LEIFARKIACNPERAISTREKHYQQLNFFPELQEIDLFEEIMTNSFQPTTRLPPYNSMMTEELNHEIEGFVSLEPVETARESDRPGTAQVQPERVQFQRQASRTNDHISDIMQTLMEPSSGTASSECVGEWFRPAETENRITLEPTLYTHVDPEIEYPNHQLRANGISFISEDGKLFATNRGKDNKQISFGLANFDRSRMPKAELMVYLSMAGKHDQIVACAGCGERYGATDFMEVTFRGERQTKEVQLSDGAIGILCPIVENVPEDNNCTYKIRFNCFTSHLKINKSDRVKLNFAIIVDGTEPAIWTDRIDLEVTANPGRDSGVFVPASRAGNKRPKTEPGLVEAKRSKLNNIKVERGHFDFLTPAAMEMIRSKMAPEQAAQFMADMNVRFCSTLTTELDLFANRQNSTG
jgi:hypothetical protein